MKKSIVLVLVVAVAVGFLWYSGYFAFGSTTSGENTVSVVAGWNDITVPDSWKDTTASEFMSQNPSITTVSYWGNGHWVSCISVIPMTNNFDIHAGMELKVLAQGACTLTAPR